MNLPITMDPFKYGNVEISNMIKEKDEIFERFIIIKDNKTFRIDVYDGVHGWSEIKCNKVNKISILGNIKLSWIDTRLDENSNYFKREIGKSTIYFLDGEIILRKKELPAKPIRRLTKDNKLINNNFYTLDIETIQIKNKVRPYLVNIFTGTKHFTVFNENEKILFDRNNQ